MAKDYKNDKRSKANKTKGQAQKNAQNIQSMWRKSTNKPSITVNERQSARAPAGGNGEPPDPPDPPGDDPDDDNNEEGRGVYEDGGGGDDSEGMR